MGAVTYKTYAEWATDLQRNIGTEVSTANAKFPPDVCLDALMEAAWLWMPWLPRHMMDVNTEIVSSAWPWNANQEVKELPTACARLIGLEMDGVATGTYYVELYGLTKERTYNDYVYRKNTLHRNQLGIKLFCLNGRALITYPIHTAQIHLNLTYRARIARPDAMTDPVTIPMEAAGFIKTAASAILLHSDLRNPQASAMEQRHVENLKTVFGIETLLVDEPERSK